MARRYLPRDFFRKAPNYLLREYFTRRGLLTDIDWDVLGEYDIEPIFEAFLEIETDLQDQISQDFQELYERTDDRGFVQAILDEAKYHGIDPDLSDRFDEMKSHLERAFWIFLNRKEEYWDGACVFWRVDKLSHGRWQKRRKLPAMPGSVDESVAEDLKQALIKHYSKQEARGRNCQVEVYRRGDEEIFYAYPEDYRQNISRFIGDRLEQQTIQPAFEIIFRHNDKKRTLDTFIQGDNATASNLQVIFAASVLKEEIEAEAEEDNLVYDLQPLLNRSFEFKWSNDLGISLVTIKAMRIRIQGEPWRRVTIEADPTHDEDAIYDLLDKVITRLPRASLFLDQVALKVIFDKTPGDRRTPTRTVVLTTPHTCRMNHDERGERIHQMLADSGIEQEDTGDVVAAEG